MNEVILIGNLTKDIELSLTKTGKTVTRFNIGVRRDENNSDFPTCMAWGKTAELLKKYCNKGSKIGITGSIQTSKYESNGKTNYRTYVLVSKVEFLNSKPQEQQAQGLPQSNDHGYFSPAATTGGYTYPDSNDLPF